MWKFFYLSAVTKYLYLVTLQHWWSLWQRRLKYRYTVHVCTWERIEFSGDGSLNDKKTWCCWQMFCSQIFVIGLIIESREYIVLFPNYSSYLICSVTLDLWPILIVQNWFICTSVWRYFERSTLEIQGYLCVYTAGLLLLLSGPQTFLGASQAF